MKTFGLAMIAAGLLAGAASANAPEREEVALRVSTAGVNFADPAAVAAFRNEVERQIEAVCNPGDRIGADLRPDFKCRQELLASLDPAVVQLAARASERAFADIQ